MAPFYAEMCDELGQQVDKSLLSDLKQKNKDKLAELDKKIADAEELEGQIFFNLSFFEDIFFSRSLLRNAFREAYSGRQMR